MYDVAIAGYGPVGAVLANELGQAGHRVVVLERQPSVYHLPRAAHFDHEAMRIFQGVGLADAVLPATCGIDGMHLVDQEGRILLAFDQPPGPTPVAYANDFMFFQPELELALRAGVERFPDVEVRLRHDVTGVSVGADHVRLEVIDLDQGETGGVDARYVVACDGARSVVRERAGLAMEDLGFRESWLVVDLLLRRDLGLPTVCQQICDPRRPTTYVPMPEPRRRFEFMLLPGEDPAVMERPEQVYELLAPWVGRTDAEIERAVVYTFMSGTAPAWRRGRVLLAGDAAHLMPPFLGQGMCSGVRDAANLAWKLDLVLRGEAGDDLLDTYQTERAPHVRAIIDLAVAVGRTICETDPEAARARDEQMLAARGAGGPAGRDDDTGALLPPLGPGLHARATGDPAAGSLFIQPWVRRADGGDARLDDVLGPGFSLLGLADPRPSPGSTAARRWAGLGGRAVEVATGPAPAAVDGVEVVEDRDGFLRRWFERRDLAAVLLRPDRYVAGSVPATALRPGDGFDPEAMERLFGVVAPITG